MKRRMMLYFGSFNPVHNGHTALAEWVVERGLCDELVLVVSPQNPLKPNSMLAPETDRFEMAELACAASKYPEKIKPSVVEFLLERPSYTIDTLRWLEENFGAQMEFSILMGTDLVNTLDRWREYESIVGRYPIYVYPRRGYEVEKFADRIHLLADAPTFDFSSTEVRRTLQQGGDAGRMVTPAVLGYIRQKGLWSAEGYVRSLDERIVADPADAEALMERGRLHYRRNEWGEALNDFGRVVELQPDHTEARQMKEMIYEILQFRYTDLYNP